jgi:hypothetical protein
MKTITCMTFLMLMVRFVMYGLTSFGRPYFVMNLSLGLIKWTHVWDSDDHCKRSIVVFRELFQQLFGDWYPSKFLLFCKMGYPPDTYPSHFKITFENCMSDFYRDTNTYTIYLVVNLTSMVIKSFTFSTIFCEVEVSERRSWGASLLYPHHF